MPINTFAIGRSRTGDQLHRCWVTVEDNGRLRGDNAHCNNHIHLRFVSGWKGEKATIKMRPGLFCKKCFGDDTARIIACEYLNAIVTD